MVRARRLYTGDSYPRQHCGGVLEIWKSFWFFLTRGEIVHRGAVFRVSEVKSYPAGVATKIGQEIVGVMMICNGSMDERYNFILIIFWYVEMEWNQLTVLELYEISFLSNHRICK